MKLQLERDIAAELDWAIDSHNQKGGRTIRRIDLDDFEWQLLLEAGPDLSRDGRLEVHNYFHESVYKYRGIEIVKR